MNIKTLEVLNGTTYVDFYAGNENKNITKIVLPDSLIEVMENAFSTCVKMTKFGIGKNLKTLKFH